MMCYACITNITLLPFTHFVLVRDAHKLLNKMAAYMHFLYKQLNKRGWTPSDNRSTHVSIVKGKKYTYSKIQSQTDFEGHKQSTSKKGILKQIVPHNPPSSCKEALLKPRIALKISQLFFELSYPSLSNNLLIHHTF